MQSEHPAPVIVEWLNREQSDERDDEEVEGLEEGDEKGSKK
jgi:hypothetical protein